LKEAPRVLSKEEKFLRLMESVTWLFGVLFLVFVGGLPALPWICGGCSEICKYTRMQVETGNPQKVDGRRELFLFLMLLLTSIDIIIMISSRFSINRSRRSI
jgi:hypothetical protein